MSAMRSASSSTTQVSASSESALRSSRSIRRPGRGHHDLDAVLQAPRLPLERLAAVDEAEAHAPVLAERRQHVVDLDRELAGGHEHERGGPARLGRRRALEQRKAEGQRLARAGLRLAAHVSAGQRVGDGERLDRETDG